MRTRQSGFRGNNPLISTRSSKNNSVDAVCIATNSSLTSQLCREFSCKQSPRNGMLTMSTTEAVWKFANCGTLWKRRINGSTFRYQSILIPPAIGNLEHGQSENNWKIWMENVHKKKYYLIAKFHRLRGSRKSKCTWLTPAQLQRAQPRKTSLFEGEVSLVKLTAPGPLNRIGVHTSPGTHVRGHSTSSMELANDFGPSKLLRRKRSPREASPANNSPKVTSLLQRRSSWRSTEMI